MVSCAWLSGKRSRIRDPHSTAPIHANRHWPWSCFNYVFLTACTLPGCSRLRGPWFSTDPYHSPKSWFRKEREREREGERERETQLSTSLTLLDAVRGLFKSLQYSLRPSLHHQPPNGSNIPKPDKLPLFHYSVCITVTRDVSKTSSTPSTAQSSFSIFLVSAVPLLPKRVVLRILFFDQPSLVLTPLLKLALQFHCRRLTLTSVPPQIFGLQWNTIQQTLTAYVRRTPPDKSYALFIDRSVQIPSRCPGLLEQGFTAASFYRKLRFPSNNHRPQETG